MFKLKMIFSLLFIGSILVGCDKADITEKSKIDENVPPRKKVSAYYSASTWEELKARLAQITANNGGGVIEITADINSGRDCRLGIPANTTISGGGSSYGVGGKKIITDLHRLDYLFLANGEYVTIQGLIIVGPYPSASPNWNYAGASGIVFGPTANFGKVQNCDISGFPGAAISISSPGNNVVYANNIHDNIAKNEYSFQGNYVDEVMGYGVMVQDAGCAYIHHNYFDNNRHAISGGGNTEVQPSYDASYNEVRNTKGARIDHHFDMHGNSNNCYAGNYIWIYNNNFYGNNVYTAAVAIRGTPQGLGELYNNTYSNIKKFYQTKDNNSCPKPGNFNVYD